MHSQPVDLYCSGAAAVLCLTAESLLKLDTALTGALAVDADLEDPGALFVVPAVVSAAGWAC